MRKQTQGGRSRASLDIHGAVRALIEALEQRRLLSSGDLDPSFGVGGRVTTDVPGSFSGSLTRTALQGDGKIVAVGATQDTPGIDFAVARYNANGSLDSTFGSNGVQSTDFTADDRAYGVAIQPDGKIVVVGEASGSLALARYNADGSPDLLFGVDGKVTTGTASDPLRGKAVAIQPDGKIVVVGSFTSPAAGALLARFNADGSLDADFSTNWLQPGIWRYGLGQAGPGMDKGQGIVIQPDGKYLILGKTSTFRQLLRVRSDGQLDFTFNAVIPVRSNLASGSLNDNADIALQPDGKILVGGLAVANSKVELAIARLLPDGSTDTSFDGDGLVTADLGSDQEEIYSVFVQPNGKIVGIGASVSLTLSRLAVVRYNADGSPDPSFDADGKFLGPNFSATGGAVQPDGAILACAGIVTRLSSSGPLDPSFDGDGIAAPALFEGSRNDQARKIVAVQPDGKLVVVGQSASTTPSTNDITVARYLADGGLDPTFGAGGIARHDFGTNEIGLAVALQSNGKILIAGQGGPGVDFLLVRLNADGTIDTSLSGGLVLTSFGGADTATCIAIQSDGKIVVGGSADTGTLSDFALARFNVDGTLDTTFDVDGKVRTGFGTSQDFIGGIAIQPDGRIVAAGLATMAGTGSDFAVARYNADGSLDATFDGDGKVTTAFPGSAGEVARSVALQVDGKIVAAGTGAQNMALARYNTNGSLDDGGANDITPGDAFGAGGMTTTDFGFTTDIGQSLVIQPNGKAVVAGGTGSDFALARYRTDGTLDPTFGIGGRVTTDFAGAVDQANGVALQADGKIVAVGLTAPAGLTSGNFALARYLGDNSAPSADAGGTYDVNEGASVVLSSAGTSDADEAAFELSYVWDLDGDSIFGEAGTNALRGDETGASPTFSAMGLDGPSSFTVKLAVTDSGGLTDEDTATIIVHNVDPSIDSVSNSPHPVEGSPASVTVNASDAAGALDPLTYYYDFDNDDVYDVVSSSATESHIYDDNGTYTVIVKVTDGDGGEDTSSISVTVSNVAPSLALLGPASGATGQPLLFMFNATDASAADQSASFTYNIDWDGNGTVDETVFAGASVQVAHAYSSTGSYTATAAAIDKDGGQSTQQGSVVTISTISQSADPSDPSKTMLVIGATDGDDQISVSPTGAGQLQIIVGSTAVTVTAPTGRIMVYGLAGNDTIEIAGSISNECWLYGDDGSDNLNLGNGGGIAFGGNGNDSLLGGSARDVLVGGRGADRVIGNPGNDILIAAYTKFDSRSGYAPSAGLPTFAPASLDHEDAWHHIYAEWNNSEGRNYLASIVNLMGTGSGSNFANRENANYFLKTEGAFATGQSVFDDGSADEIDFLTGSSGEDWFLANTGNSSGESGAIDQIAGGGSGETTSDTDVV